VKTLRPKRFASSGQEDVRQAEIAEKLSTEVSEKRVV
jgi:hypothetical protein